VRACVTSFVTANGFVELVKSRNAMAKALGYGAVRSSNPRTLRGRDVRLSSLLGGCGCVWAAADASRWLSSRGTAVDYYDYKVTQAEGFGKDALFAMLDTLEQGTRPLMLEARKRLADEKGDDALQPWNTGFMMAGSITKKVRRAHRDPSAARPPAAATAAAAASCRCTRSPDALVRRRLSGCQRLSCLRCACMRVPCARVPYASLSRVSWPRRSSVAARPVLPL
jgi:hypothetical protein